MKELTKEELLEGFEAIISNLEKQEEGNVTHDWLISKYAVSDAREKFEQLKLGIL